jgi:DNA excision repair protein ERCC-4
LKIFIDSREDGAVFSAFRRAAVDEGLLKTLKESRIEIIQENNMESGDFVCGEYAIEHKSPSDYRNSVYNRHLNDQIQTMKRNFKECAIAFSGEPHEIFYDKVGTGSFASFMAQGAPVMICGNLDNMAIICIKLLHKWNDEKVRDNNPSINQKVYKDPQVNIITGIPNIGETSALALLDKFGSVGDVCNASVAELTEVKGIGKSHAMEIFNALHSVRW